MASKSFSVDIDEKISEAFTEQVKERGYTKYRAIEGALRAFMTLPSELQVTLMLPDLTIEQAGNAIHDFEIRRELRKIAENLTPEQRTQILADAKASEERVLKKKKG